MKRRILVAPNSFKECANSVTIAKLIAENLALLNHDLIIKPVSDGGDGFLSVCKFYFDGELRKYKISTAYDNSAIECPVIYCKDKNHIYIESAEVLELKVVPSQYRNPLKLSSKGLGELLKQIENDIRDGWIEVNKVFVGIGGTATVDLGLGMMGELGLNLFDKLGLNLSVLPEDYYKVKKVEYNPINFSFNIIPVVDVKNPLFGVEGGIQAFGRQKGADQKVLTVIEDGFSNILNILKNNGLQIFYNQLSGAGGGLPAAFQIFTDSQLLHSKEFICNNLDLHSFLENESLDYLITGEGSYDNQSGLGKGAGILIDLLASRVQKIFLLCGRINKDTINSLPSNVIPIETSEYFETDSDSILNYKKGIEMACLEIVKQLNF